MSDLGKHSTWIKWSVPTAEALRQACLAQESRICQSTPEMPNTWISRISVDNSRFLGPIELELNPQFSAIIGGRGTGKSTILDYVRWALCDLPAKIEASEEMGDPIIRQRKLIESTLAPTESTVEIHFTINDIRHVVRRNASSGDLTLKVGDAEFVKAREDEVRELLPIQAYSQKQLSSVSVRIDELTRFVTSPIRRQLATIDQNVAEAAGKIRENYATLQRQRQLQVSIHRSELSEQSLAEQAINLRGSLEDVSEDDRLVLDDKPRFDASNAAADTWHQIAGRTLDGAEEFFDSLDDLDARLEPTLTAPQPLEQPITELKLNTLRVLTSFRDSVASALDTLRSELSGTSDHQRLYEAIEHLVEEFEVAYLAVKERSTAHAAKLAELAEVERQHRSAGESLRGQRNELQTLGQPDVQHHRFIHELFELMESRSQELERQCASLSDLSSGLLRATLQRGQGLNDVGEQFRAAVAGSGLRGNKVEGVFDQLRLEESPAATWEAALLELEALTMVGEEEEPTTERFPVLARLGLPVADLRRVTSRLTPDKWLTLALTPISDHPKFEYRTKEDEYIDFETASAGQQATALLRVLLAQSGPPLIIDQPEDDLDSEVVLEVVQQIWAAKCHRQLFFSSHNANLVVNGDAELVVHCDYRVRGEQSRGEIKDQGAIDSPEIRRSIVRVMDGGEKAFKLRADKYGF